MTPLNADCPVTDVEDKQSSRVWLVTCAVHPRFPLDTSLYLNENLTSLLALNSLGGPMPLELEPGHMFQFDRQVSLYAATVSVGTIIIS